MVAAPRFASRTISKSKVECLDYSEDISLPGAKGVDFGFQNEVFTILK